MAQQIEQAATREQRFKMTYEEFLEQVDEDVVAEWVDGEVIVFMPPSIRHERISRLLYFLIGLFIEQHDLGEVFNEPCEMLLLPGRLSRRPDILFVAKEHADRITARSVAGPADLVIELVSDTSVTRDYDEKFAEYQSVGVREYWIIDTRLGKERMVCYQLGADGKYQVMPADAEGRYHATVVPGFWINPEWLWQEPLPPVMALLQRINAN
jgi:Uma2 family endonuclease